MIYELMGLQKPGFMNSSGCALLVSCSLEEGRSSSIPASPLPVDGAFPVSMRSGRGRSVSRGPLGGAAAVSPEGPGPPDCPPA